MTVTWPGAGKRTERGQLGHGVLFNDQGREGHAMHGIALYGMVLNSVIWYCMILHGIERCAVQRPREGEGHVRARALEGRVQ